MRCDESVLAIYEDEILAPNRNLDDLIYFQKIPK